MTFEWGWRGGEGEMSHTAREAHRFCWVGVHSHAVGGRSTGRSLPRWGWTVRQSRAFMRSGLTRENQIMSRLNFEDTGPKVL
jgi:hypothetical protein